MKDKNDYRAAYQHDKQNNYDMENMSKPVRYHHHDWQNNNRENLLHGLREFRQNRTNKSLHAPTLAMMPKNIYRMSSDANPNLSLQHFSNSLNKIDNRAIRGTKQLNGLNSFGQNQIQSQNQIRNRNIYNINPGESLGVFQKELNDLLYEQRQRKRAERQKYFKDNVLKPELTMTKKKYAKQKLELISQMHSLKSELEKTRLEEQIEDKKIERMHKIILPALNNQQMRPRIQQPQIQPLSIFFQIPPPPLPAQQIYYRYQQSVPKKSQIKKSTKNLLRKFKAAAYAVIFSRFFPKYSVNFTRNRVKIRLQKSKIDRTKDFLNQQNINALIENLNIPQMCLEIYSGFTIPKEEIQSTQERYRQGQEYVSQQEQDNNEQKQSFQVRHKHKKSKPKVTKSQPQKPKQKLFLDLNISSKFVLQFLDRLAFQIEEKEILQPFYQTMANCFLDRAFILDHFLLIQQLRSLNFHTEKGYSKISKSWEKTLIAFNVLVKMFFTPIFSLYLERQSRAFNILSELVQSQQIADFYSSQIRLNMMISFGVFSCICQRQIFDLTAKQGNFFSLKSTLQTLPSIPLNFVNNLMKKNSNGRDINGMLHRDMASILKEVPGFDNFKKLIQASSNNLVKDSKLSIDRIVNFLHVKIQQAKKKQYQVAKNMTFEDIFGNHFREYDMTLFQIRDKKEVGKSTIIHDYLNDWGLKLKPKRIKKQNFSNSQMISNELLQSAENSYKNAMNKLPRQKKEHRGVLINDFNTVLGKRFSDIGNHQNDNQLRINRQKIEEKNSKTKKVLRKSNKKNRSQIRQVNRANQIQGKKDKKEQGPIAKLLNFF